MAYIWGWTFTEANHRLVGSSYTPGPPTHCGLAISKVDHAHYVEGFSGLAISKTQTWLWVVQNWWNGGTILI
jgi:hypothetical protein